MRCPPLVVVASWQPAVMRLVMVRNAYVRVPAVLATCDGCGGPQQPKERPAEMRVSHVGNAALASRSNADVKGCPSTHASLAC